jgi:hypothetical protein
MLISDRDWSAKTPDEKLDWLRERLQRIAAHIDTITTASVQRAHLEIDALKKELSEMRQAGGSDRRD